MPAKVKKNPDDGYSVSTPNAVHAKNTTKEKAEAQKRLLNAIDHGFKPTGKVAKGGTKGNRSGGEDGTWQKKRSKMYGN